MQEPEAEAEAWQLGNQAIWQFGEKSRTKLWRLGNQATGQLGDAGRKEQSAER
jgi:hypothetical protein